MTPPCACGNKNSGTAAPKSYVVTLPGGGGKKTYRTEVEAIAAAKRLGGTWKAQ